MKDLFRFHSWRVTPDKAINIQNELRQFVIIKDCTRVTRYVAACDVSFDRNDKASACIAIFSYPTLELIEEKTVSMKVSFPYIPTLLTFREGPILLRCIKRLKTNPDLFLFDGQGIAHPRRMGLAAHMGIILDKPSIGCAKTNLFGNYEMPENKKGAYCLLKDKDEILGAVLRTRKDVKPVFVSPGHKTNLNKSIEIIMNLTDRFRIPQPLRYAHKKSKELLK